MPESQSILLSDRGFLRLDELIPTSGSLDHSDP